jgi:regulator of ribonuclease activity B
MGWLSKKTPPSSQADLDTRTLEQLKKAGSDLTQPHAVDNFLYFRDEATAERAATRLRPSSTMVDISPGAKGNTWLTKAVVTVVPTPANVAEMRRRMEAVAGEFNGDYDGWGAPIVPRS